VVGPGGRITPVPEPPHERCAFCDGDAGGGGGDDGDDDDPDDGDLPAGTGAMPLGPTGPEAVP
jgi:hypothetical protein